MVAAGTAPSTVGRMIKDRPHRLDLIYIHQPLYFVTFATRDRRSIPSLPRAQLAVERYGHRGIAKFSVALGRYVIMPDHVHLFVRGGPDFTLSSWIGGLKRAMSVAVNRRDFGNLGFLITFCAATKVTQKNGTTFVTIPFELILSKLRTTGHTTDKLG
jgi:REP element-mobilizing transposase RayT